MNRQTETRTTGDETMTTAISYRNQNYSSANFIRLVRQYITRGAVYAIHGLTTDRIQDARMTPAGHVCFVLLATGKTEDYTGQALVNDRGDELDLR